jgi:hypothetical protein
MTSSVVIAALIAVAESCEAPDRVVLDLQAMIDEGNPAVIPWLADNLKISQWRLGWMHCNETDRILEELELDGKKRKLLAAIDEISAWRRSWPDADPENEEWLAEKRRRAEMLPDEEG